MTDPLAAATAAADRIERTMVRDLNAVLAYGRRQLIEQAVQAGEGPLSGTTVAVKDNICTREYPTTCASRILRGYRSPYEATAVSRLRAVGAVIACKTNLDEFGMGSSTEHSAFGPTRHPFDPERVPGGSSGGSAALVADGAVDAALGSETGGSVRQPAAFCGVVGVKPTYGRVSRYGLVAFGSSLDQIGVFGKSVAMAGRVLDAIAGPDANDSTTVTEAPAVLGGAPSLRNMTIGLPVEYFPSDLHPAVRAACDRVVASLRDAGARIRNVTLPHTHLAVPAYYVIAPAEASANLARFDGVRYGLRITDPVGDVHAMIRATRGAGFGAEVRRRILIGTYVLSAGYYDAFYRKAQVARGLIAEDFTRVFREGVDLLFTPTTPTPAFKAGEKTGDPLSMYLADIFVCPCNLAGVPAISLPVGRSGGLPLGGQFIAPPFAENVMMGAAAELERMIDGAGEVR